MRRPPRALLLRVGGRHVAPIRLMAAADVPGDRDGVIDDVFTSVGAVVPVGGEQRHRSLVEARPDGVVGKEVGLFDSMIRTDDLLVVFGAIDV